MIHIKVNGKVLFKGDLGDWEERPPDEFRDAIRPGRRPDPWLKAVLVTMADAVVMDGDLRINVTTGPGEWTMKVRTTKL